jgi:hypothetical protein
MSSEPLKAVVSYASTKTVGVKIMDLASYFRATKSYEEGGTHFDTTICVFGGRRISK